MDLLKYPWDPRADLNQRVGSTRIFHIENQKFMYVTNMYVVGLMIYRFEAELAIPCAAITKNMNPFNLPNAPVNMSRANDEKYIWTDLNGTGYPDANEFQLLNSSYIFMEAWALNIDDNGTIWAGGIREIGVEAYYYNYINSFGVPMWSHTTRKVWPTPKSMLGIQRAIYIPSEDLMYLSGPTVLNNYNAGEYWGMAGLAIQKYVNWTSNPNVTKVPVAEYKLPNQTSGGPCIKAIDIHQNILFGAHFRTGQVYIIDLSDGELLATMDPIWAQGWIDMPYAITVNRRVSNGEWIVIVEEDDHNKNTVYTIPDGQSCLPPL